MQDQTGAQRRQRAEGRARGAEDAGQGGGCQRAAREQERRPDDQAADEGGQQALAFAPAGRARHDMQFVPGEAERKLVHRQVPLTSPVADADVILAILEPLQKAREVQFQESKRPRRGVESQFDLPADISRKVPIQENRAQRRVG